MDLYDLDLAFYKRLRNLDVSDLELLRPDQVLQIDELDADQGYRRGMIADRDVGTIGFGDGVYSRLTGVYEISLAVPRRSPGAYKRLLGLADQHSDHFFPSNGRGLTLSEGNVLAQIVRRPVATIDQRRGRHVLAVLDVDFHVDIPPTT